ncbi:hypothetical protein [Muribaculum intestinale]|uniref:hypothetical protein n=1 Tax=Muribaculum intestinale TaxID=1796646 RepID=UPI003F6683C6
MSTNIDDKKVEHLSKRSVLDYDDIVAMVPKGSRPPQADKSPASLAVGRQSHDVHDRYARQSGP